MNRFSFNNFQWKIGTWLKPDWVKERKREQGWASNMKYIDWNQNHYYTTTRNKAKEKERNKIIFMIQTGPGHPGLWVRINLYPILWFWILLLLLLITQYSHWRLTHAERTWTYLSEKKTQLQLHQVCLRSIGLGPNTNSKPDLSDLAKLIFLFCFFHFWFTRIGFRF